MYNLACVVNHKFGKVPAHRLPYSLVGQFRRAHEFEDIVGLGTVDVALLVHVASGRIKVQDAQACGELFNLGLGPRLLLAILIAGEQQDTQPSGAVFFAKGRELLVVGLGFASLARDVRNDQDLAFIFGHGDCLAAICVRPHAAVSEPADPPALERKGGERTNRDGGNPIKARVAVTNVLVLPYRRLQGAQHRAAALASIGGRPCARGWVAGGVAAVAGLGGWVACWVGGSIDGGGCVWMGNAR